MFSSKTNFSGPEALATLRASQNKVEDHLGDKIYVTISQTAVITESQVRQDVEQILNGRGKLSSGLISAQLDLELEVISPIVKELTAKDPDVYVYLDTILCKESGLNIIRSLKESITHNNLVDGVKFCYDENTDIKVVQWACNRLAAQGFNVLTLGNYFIESSRLSEFRAQTVQTINSLDSISDLKTLEVPDVPREILELFVRDITSLSGELNGSVDSTKRYFPNSIKEAEQQQLLEELKSSGVITLDLSSATGRLFQETVQRELKVDDVIILNKHVVTNDFICWAASMADELLGSQGWLNLLETVDAVDSTAEKQLLIERYVVPKLTRKVLFIDMGGGSRYAIARQLIKDQIVDYFSNQAVTKMEAIVLGASPRSLFRLAETKSYGLTTQEMKEHLMNSHAMSSSLADQLVAKTIKETKEVHDKILERGIQTNINKINQERAAKLTIYLVGIQNIMENNKKTGQKLYKELMGYAAEKLDEELPEEFVDALPLINDASKINQAMVKDTREQLASNYLRQLQKAGEPDKLLLSAVLYLFSTKTQGALRATGKYVPKILNYLETTFPEDERIGKCIELKKGIVEKRNKHELEELGNALKNKLVG